MSVVENVQAGSRGYTYGGPCQLKHRAWRETRRSRSRSLSIFRISRPTHVAKTRGSRSAFPVQPAPADILLTTSLRARQLAVTKKPPQMRCGFVALTA